MTSVAGARGRNLAPNIAYIATLVILSTSLARKKMLSAFQHLAAAAEFR
jgi:hypothetical protein